MLTGDAPTCDYAMRMQGMDSGDDNERIAHLRAIGQSFERSPSNCMGNDEVPFEVRQRVVVHIVLA